MRGIVFGLAIMAVAFAVGMAAAQLLAGELDDAAGWAGLALAGGVWLEVQTAPASSSARS